MARFDLAQVRHRHVRAGGGVGPGSCPAQAGSLRSQGRTLPRRAAAHPRRPRSPPAPVRPPDPQRQLHRFDQPPATRPDRQPASIKRTPTGQLPPPAPGRRPTSNTNATARHPPVTSPGTTATRRRLPARPGRGPGGRSDLRLMSVIGSPGPSANTRAAQFSSRQIPASQAAIPRPKDAGEPGYLRPIRCGQDVSS